MPSRWYRTNLRNKANDLNRYQALFITSDRIFDATTVENVPDTFSIVKIQDDILKIIESIALRTELDKVLTAVTDVRNTIKTKVDLLELITTIENLVLSIITNIANRVSLDIVLQRIRYLKELVDKLEPTCCVSYDGPYVSMLMDIFTMIIEAININDIQTSMSTVYNKIHKSVENICLIEQAEELVVGILQNLANRVSLDIVKQRILYLQEILTRIDEDCFFYCSKWANQILEIMDLLTQIGSSGSGIVAELDTIIIKTQAFYNVLFLKKECARIVKESEALVLSIIDNLANRVSLDIISQRLTYLQEILRRAQIV
jgi:hypothetical protein